MATQNGYHPENNVDHRLKSLSVMLAKLGSIQTVVEGFRNGLKNEFNFNLLAMVNGLASNIQEIVNEAQREREFYKFIKLRPHLTPSPDLVDLGYFSVVPNEILEYIFRFLDAKDVGRAGQVCRAWKHFADDDALWQQLCLAKFGERVKHDMPPSKIARTWRWLYHCKAYHFPRNVVRNGCGRFEKEDGNVYEGEWKDNQRHGVGIGKIRDGRQYVGEWMNDKRTGFGVFTWPPGHKNCGDIYEGEWKDSKRDGHGVYRWADGHCYDGEWREGKREGQGTATWPDGRWYRGEYRHGKMHGQGVLRAVDGTEYEGDFMGGRKHGRGKEARPDGHTFVGYFEHNRRTNGIVTYADGSVYEGQFGPGDVRQGTGKYRWPNGYTFDGRWESNLPVRDSETDTIVLKPPPDDPAAGLLETDYKWDPARYAKPDTPLPFPQARSYVRPTETKRRKLQ